MSQKDKYYVRIYEDKLGVPANAFLIVVAIYILSLMGTVWVWAWIATTIVMGLIEVYL